MLQATLPEIKLALSSKSRDLLSHVISECMQMRGRISRQGATEICIFDGIMGADLFCNVLETTLILFIIIIKVTSTSSCRIMT